MERIPLGNTVFEGRNNVYLLDGETTALVDTGVATGDVRDELAAGLADRGLAFADVDEILLTHWHFDHSGLAGEIQDESGATVRVHEADAPLVANDPDAVERERELRQRRFVEWGIPEDRRLELQEFMDGHGDLRGRSADVTPFRDGDTVSVGGLTLRAVHLPGHAAGLAAFVAEAGLDGSGDPVAFVGDVVLPKYTPNVGGADVRVDRPLARYADSLVRLVGLDLDRAFPGHRDPIADPTDRALTILEHHRERTRRVVDVLAENGPCDAWTVSAHLFGGLEGIHVLHGPGEAYAHLDHLVAGGVVEERDGEYELAEEDPDVAALFPDPDPRG